MEVIIIGLSFFVLGAVAVSFIILGIGIFLKEKNFRNLLLLLFMAVNGAGVVFFPVLLFLTDEGRGHSGFACIFLFVLIILGIVFLSLIKQKR